MTAAVRSSMFRRRLWRTYPSFVAAHNALGITYLNLGQTQKARDEFLRAVELDRYLPASYLNLGCAQLELQQYPEAEESLKKALRLRHLIFRYLRLWLTQSFRTVTMPL